eukprot:1148881-Pelagomonas_calceolata.AAC.5
MAVGEQQLHELTSCMLAALLMPVKPWLKLSGTERNERVARKKNERVALEKNERVALEKNERTAQRSLIRAAESPHTVQGNCARRQSKWHRVVRTLGHNMRAMHDEDPRIPTKQGVNTSRASGTRRTGHHGVRAQGHSNNNNNNNNMGTERQAYTLQA